jgi:hypothetical protein
MHVSSEKVASFPPLLCCSDAPLDLADHVNVAQAKLPERSPPPVPRGVWLMKLELRHRLPGFNIIPSDVQHHVSPIAWNAWTSKPRPWVVVSSLGTLELEDRNDVRQPSPSWCPRTYWSQLLPTVVHVKLHLRRIMTFHLCQAGNSYYGSISSHSNIFRSIIPWAHGTSRNGKTESVV